VRVYTISEARQRLAMLLEEPRRDGAVRIRRRDGTTFMVMPEPAARSPLDVEGVQTDVTLDEILGFIHESRRPT
jgi:antitoxin Phd